MITEEMGIKLLEIYSKNKLFRPTRKYVKVLVDSLLEQLCQIYLGTVPGGVMNMRKEINLHINNFSGLDREILHSMKEILNEYAEVFSKKYTSHNESMNEFLDNKLKKLVQKLIDGSYINISLLNQECGEEYE